MTGVQILYYFVCPRKLWLFINHIEMEQTSDAVELGKLISESTYQREKHELHLVYDEDEIVIDFFDSKNKKIHEIKKSNKMEATHIWQVKFYIYVLEKMGIKGVTGEIDYPKLRKVIEVKLDDNDKKKIEEIKRAIRLIVSNDIPPQVINKPFCKNCAYYELCYV